MTEKNHKNKGLGIIALGGILILGIVLLQYFTPLSLNSSILYTAVVLLTLFIPDKRFTLIFAAISTLFIIGTFIFHFDRVNSANLLSAVFVNRAFALTGVWVAFFVIRDVRTNAEQASRSTERLNALFEHATEGIIISGGKGEIVMVNPEAEKQFGYKKEELLGKRIEILIPQRFSGHHVQHRKDYYQKPHSRYMGQGMNLFAKRKDSSEFPVEISLSSFTTSEGMFVVSFILDITERKKQDELIQLEKEKAQSYLDVAPVIFLVVNNEGNVDLINKAGCRIFGYEEKEILGKNWITDFIPPDAQAHCREIYDPIFNQNTLVSDEYENYIQTKSSGRRLIAWKISTLKDEKGRIIATLSSGEDITEKKTQEEFIRKAHDDLKDYSQRLQESNSELEQFAYISSHDLQEPLRKIQSFGDRLKLKEAEQLSDNGKEYIDRMLNAASRMQNLINDLLAFSRVTSKAKPFEKVDLNYVMKGVLSDLEITIEKSQAKIEVMTQMPTIDADPMQMRQVFQNLISNAIKFRKEGHPPVIKIHTRNIASDEKGMEGRPMVEIYFEDNGIGFDEKYTDRIFNIFQRLEGQKYEGSGIGLAICKKIALRHGGDITAKSEIGKGSVFIVKLALYHAT